MWLYLYYTGMALFFLWLVSDICARNAPRAR